MNPPKIVTRSHLWISPDNVDQVVVRAASRGVQVLARHYDGQSATAAEESYEKEEWDKAIAELSVTLKKAGVNPTLLGQSPIRDYWYDMGDDTRLLMQETRSAEAGTRWELHNQDDQVHGYAPTWDEAIHVSTEVALPLFRQILALNKYKPSPMSGMEKYVRIG